LSISLSKRAQGAAFAGQHPSRLDCNTVAPSNGACAVSTPLGLGTFAERRRSPLAAVLGATDILAQDFPTDLIIKNNRDLLAAVFAL
jgi:hypothetical protein